MRPRFLTTILATILVLLTHHAAAQDAVAGQQVFKSQCSVCHSVAPGRTLTGPSLFGVVGRTAGSVQGFHYSAANKGSGIVWSAQTLDPYLTNPKQVIPGTTMTYPGLKDAKQRTDLIAYLSTLH
jgi:cytochrome c